MRAHLQTRFAIESPFRPRYPSSSLEYHNHYSPVGTRSRVLRSMPPSSPPSASPTALAAPPRSSCVLLPKSCASVPTHLFSLLLAAIPSQPLPISPFVQPPFFAAKQPK